jgi:hypothetical protein
MSLTDHRNLYQLVGMRNTNAVHQEYIWMMRGALLSTCETANPAFKQAVIAASRRAATEQREDDHHEYR